MLYCVTKPCVGNKYAIYTVIVSYYALMRNVKYISMTQGLTCIIKTLYDAKQPIISVHYFLKAQTWVRSLYIFNGNMMLCYKDKTKTQKALLDLHTVECTIRCSELKYTNEDLKAQQGHN